MRRKINSKYLQSKEAYLKGFEEGFSTAYHLGNKGEYYEGHRDGFSEAFRIALEIDEAFTKDGGGKCN